MRKRSRKSARPSSTPKLLEALDIPKDKRTPEQKRRRKECRGADQAGLGRSRRSDAAGCEGEARQAARAAPRESNPPRPIRCRRLTRSSTPARPRRRATCCAWAIRTASSIRWSPPCHALFKASFEIPKVPPRPPHRARQLAGVADNPLTARVMVNRIWQFRMGNGLVRTPNDFGMMGDKPAAPQPARLAGRGIHGARLERQGDGPADRDFERLPAVVRDRTQRKRRSIPRTGCFWRMNRKRFDAEMIRDAALSVAGTLNPRTRRHGLCGFRSSPKSTT